MRPLRHGLMIAAAIMILDQITKWVIIERVMSPPRLIEVTGFFDLVMTWNRGVSFGMLNRESDWNVPLLTGLALVIVSGLLVWLRKATTPWIIWAIGLIIGGALGNVIDRLRFGAVADFLSFHLGGYYWPAFNLADSAISVGAGLLILDSLFLSKESTKNTP
jgi:signal peptidase II